MPLVDQTPRSHSPSKILADIPQLRSSKDETPAAEPEEIAVPVGDLGKSHQFSKSKMSDPSHSIDEINVPEVTDLTAEFVYNYYTVDERVAPYQKDATISTVSSINGQKVLRTNHTDIARIPRYVSIKWNAPVISKFESSQQDTSQDSSAQDLSIEGNHDKVISEDNFFNESYVNHTFSSIEAIEQGATDLENYSRFYFHDAESLSKMSKYQIQSAADVGDKQDQAYQAQLGKMSDAYGMLSDFPQTSFGLRVYDEKKNLNDSDDLLRSITDSLTLTMKINSSVIPDVFKDSAVKQNADHLNNLRVSHSNFKFASTRGNASKAQEFDPVYNDSSATETAKLKHPAKMLGYIIDRYVATGQDFRKEKTFFVESIATTSFLDDTVLYGYTYVYTVRVVSAVKLLTYNSDSTEVDVSTVYVSSRPISYPIETFEYQPPPPPNDLKFVFDYVKRNLVVKWDMPSNPQKDVKQFQVMRRKSIKEPFELIAQYGFDTSRPGMDQERYKTGEAVDANNTSQMDQGLLYLVKTQTASNADKSYPIYIHVDEDFTVDPEFYESSAYIYAICSIDAHGLISNYSSQHHVTFDSYKNRLVTSVVCDAGSPRAYPNMNLRMDAFKDVISVEGDIARKLTVYFSPEYLKLRDEKNSQYKVVEAQTNTANPYYLFQMINLDNQKLQLLKINIKDPQNLTT